MTEVHTYRSAGQAWAGAAMTVFFGFLTGASALSARNTGGTVVWIAWGLCICAISLRLALAGVLVDRTGIRVRNLFNGFSLRWDEIEKFDIGRSGALGAVCRIHIRDGRVLRAFGIQESHLAMAGLTHPALQIVESLNGHLRKAQNAGARPSSTGVSSCPGAQRRFSPQPSRSRSR